MLIIMTLLNNASASTKNSGLSFFDMDIVLKSKLRLQAWWMQVLNCVDDSEAEVETTAWLHEQSFDLPLSV